MEFLSAFEATNAAALPERLVSDRLGMMPGGVLVTPTTSIGGHVAYIGEGHDRFKPGRDASAYDRSLREITTWKGAYVLWLLLGLALASPFLPRLKLRRYPVVDLAGDSNAGKTTACHFSMGRGRPRARNRLWRRPIAPLRRRSTASSKVWAACRS
ncbi:DUF927 domain-containing protein [Deinococcus apachensis]|uniref:DUF927 domain-containing protein n=1 Tax=Deinococcus apachensis TaxID=309886 RepID=UPI000381344F|nr:DUF927 domain-containing protein [Deinococcus apachensis]